MPDQVIERSDEDRIIENIVIEGSKKLYEDLDFLPTRQSLYISDKHIPDYDENVFHKVTWCRPQEIYPNATYFDANIRNLFIQKGSLPNELFLNAIMALCSFPRFDFLENIFISDPANFVQYGVYTCRFYVDGDWVEVVTDTFLPCLRVKSGQNGEDSPIQAGDVQLLYGRSLLINEMWVSLLEKAFAKAVGSYEAIASMKIQKILLHLTGGSVQYASLRDEVMKWDSQASSNITSSVPVAQNSGSNRSEEGLAWKEFKKLIKKDAITMLLPDDSKYQDIATDAPDAQGDNPEGGDQDRIDSNFFIPNTLYTVITYKEINGYELVLLHCPWQANPYYSTDPRVQATNPATSHYYYEWTGEWSDSSNDWDIYPEILIEVERDPSIPWRRGFKEGYFWISFRSLIKYFNMRYTCHVFPTSLGYNFYCVKGECRGQQAAGPLYSIRDKDTVIKEAQQSKSNAVIKRTCSVVVDGDPSFFNNPQYRISLPSSATSATLYVSLVPLANLQDGETDAPQMSVSIMSSHKHFSFTPNAKSSAPTPILGSHSLWDISQYEVLATDRTNKSIMNVKGQEVSIWSIPITSKNYYHIIPNLLKKNKENDFILRIFSTQPINVEILPPLLMTKLHGEWRKTSDNDSTGGPLLISSNNKLKENNKWGQNPQFHLQLVNPYNKDDLFIKIVLRKVDVVRRGSKTNNKLTSSSNKTSASGHNSEDKRLNATIGLVICKAEILEDQPKKKKNEPRQNKFGEPIPPKESSLKKKPVYETPDAQVITSNSQQSHKTILRKLHLPIPPSIVAPTFVSKGNDPSELATNNTKSSSNIAMQPPAPTTLASFSSIANLNSTYITTSFTDKNEATIFFPYLPRTWINNNGILIIPCLSEKGIRSDFELEVYSSEVITLQALPENCTRTLISEWTEATAGGSKLFDLTWKKNPKFSVRLSSRALADAQNSSRTEFMWRITLKKIGNSWDKGKHDIVGNMIGLYIFHVKGTEQNLIHQTDFVPGNSDTECVTEGLFLPALQNSSEYFIIMPTTFNDKIVGPFALSIISECEFHLKKES